MRIASYIKRTIPQRVYSIHAYIRMLLKALPLSNTRKRHTDPRHWLSTRLCKNWPVANISKITTHSYFLIRQPVKLVFFFFWGTRDTNTRKNKETDSTLTKKKVRNKGTRNATLSTWNDLPTTAKNSTVYWWTRLYLPFQWRNALTSTGGKSYRESRWIRST